MKVCPSCKAEYSGGEVFCPLDATRLTTPSQMSVEQPRGIDPLVGSILNDRYRIRGPIGQGGMGIVYEALHEVLEKRVALKVLRNDFSSRPDVVERFRQEAKSASRIGHEHIVDISDFGETPQGQSYFVMEFLDGEDLANVLARERSVEPKRAVRIILQCCHALGAAHAKGIVHRDMKPENIFLTHREGRPDFVKIVDFGIAKMSDIEVEGGPGRKLTKTGMIFGTPEYMSPEQAGGRPLDHRVDIYALGIILYEMLTGKVPFVADTFMGILSKHMFDEVQPLAEAGVDVPPELEATIAVALHKDPEERFYTAADFAEALASSMDITGSFGEATAPGFGEPVVPRRLPPRTGDTDTGATIEMATGRPRPRGSRGGWLPVAAAAVVAGSVGWVAFGESRATREIVAPSAVGGLVETPEASSAAAPVDQAPTAAAVGVEPRSAEAEEPMVAPDPEPSVVELTVRTDPMARVRLAVEGETVCEVTPCTFPTEPGKPVEIRAVSRLYRGTTTVTPDRSISIQLPIERRRSSPRRTQAGRARTPMERPRGLAGGLKRPPEFDP